MQPLHSMTVTHKYLDFQAWLTAALAKPGCYLDGFSEEEITTLRKEENPEVNIWICNHEGSNVGVWFSKWNHDNDDYTWSGVLFAEPSDYQEWSRDH